MYMLIHYKGMHVHTCIYMYIHVYTLYAYVQSFKMDAYGSEEQGREILFKIRQQLKKFFLKLFSLWAIEFQGTSIRPDIACT